MAFLLHASDGLRRMRVFAVFWRGSVLLRLEEVLGMVPGILLGSALYAAYRLGYAMLARRMVFPSFVGIMFAVAFRVTRSIAVLWLVLQAMGQSVR